MPEMPSRQRCTEEEFLYERALEIARKRDKISAMVLQKRLGCALLKCAEMIRRMEQDGVVEKSRLAVKRVRLMISS
jgi:Ftsk gamma domain